MNERKKMVCKHLSELEAALKASDALETFRGQAWSANCREWVYFDVVLNVKKLQQRFTFGPSVQVHENLDIRSGQERGFKCTLCHDAIVGPIQGSKVFE